MARIPAEKLYAYLDVAERSLLEGHLWLGRQILGALEDIAEEDNIVLPEKYYSLLGTYHSECADKLLYDFLSSRSKP